MDYKNANAPCTRLSLGVEMERVKSMKRKCQENDCCSTVVLTTHLILHVVLFILFLILFGVPSVKKYLDKETIVIYSEEQSNGIEAPAITFVAMRKTPSVAKGWKSAHHNITFETFAMFDHCQGLNFTNMDVCLKNDTIARDRFLKSASIGSWSNTTLIAYESSSSLWSEDATNTYMGRHFTLKPSTPLAPTYDGLLIFELDSIFDYSIWLHDENFFIPNQSPFGPPSKYWKITTNYDPVKNITKPEPGLYHHITLTKQKKLNLEKRPCEENPSYSFATCTKERLSQKIGCRLPWDRWSNQDRKVCESENEFKQFEQTYTKLYFSESDAIEDIVGCKKPCNYNEFKFVYSSPEVVPSIQNIVAFWAATRKTQVEEEILLYPFDSFVAEFGGALGLFLGFSFMTIWQEIKGCFGK